MARVPAIPIYQASPLHILVLHRHSSSHRPLHCPVLIRLRNPWLAGLPVVRLTLQLELAETITFQMSHCAVQTALPLVPFRLHDMTTACNCRSPTPFHDLNPRRITIIRIILDGPDNCLVPCLKSCRSFSLLLVNRGAKDSQL
jgi:hypothetical protein